jgi:hypothetical protein
VRRAVIGCENIGKLALKVLLDNRPSSKSSYRTPASRSQMRSLV